MKESQVCVRDVGDDGRSATIELYRCQLDVDEVERHRLARTLSEEECRRATRFRFDIDRYRFVVGRARVRTLLGIVLGIDPAAVPIVTLDRGKPALDPMIASNIRFNLAHSYGVALLALTVEREVGVDVECVRRGFAHMGIAEQFFAPAEVAALRSMPSAEQEAAFYRGWTRKEAYVKARGGGLSIALAAFEVSMEADAGDNVLRSSHCPQDDVGRWSVFDTSWIFHGPVHAAVAVEASTACIVREEWPS
jgi:4'-phosphopantetheinyl transferase